jgi:hypothetical protein
MPASMATIAFAISAMIFAAAVLSSDTRDGGLIAVLVC